MADILVQILSNHVHFMKELTWFLFRFISTAFVPSLPCFKKLKAFFNRSYLDRNGRLFRVWFCRSPTAKDCPSRKWRQIWMGRRRRFKAPRMNRRRRRPRSRRCRSSRAWPRSSSSTSSGATTASWTCGTWSPSRPSSFVPAEIDQ